MHTLLGSLVSVSSLLCLSFPLVPLRAADAEAKAPSVTLTFDADLGRVHIPAVINESGPQPFLLDTGYTIDMIRPQLADSLGLRRSGRIDIIGIAGREEAALYRGVAFQFGGMEYRPRRVAALPSHDRRRRGGILGGDFFQRFVIEISVKDATVILHDPDRFDYTGSGQVFPLTFDGETPVMETVVASQGQSIAARFEIDTGCDGAMCMDGGFVRQHPWVKLAEDGRPGERRGVGGGARTETGRIGEVRLGTLKVESPMVNFFESGSLAGEGLAGHVGFELLKPYRMIFDYERKRLILE